MTRLLHMNPSEWSIEGLLRAWDEQIEYLVTDGHSFLPSRRIRLQAESNPEVAEILKTWEHIPSSQRVSKWKRLVEITEMESRKILHTCVQCGECCRQGSPSLYLEDLELLKEGGNLPYDRLITFRRGEPVRDPQNGTINFLLDERIKLMEKPGTNECIFFDEKSFKCIIYEHRPLQCRAQACWDSSAFMELKEQPYLTRRDILGEIDFLINILEEHNKRCGFEKLHYLFQMLPSDPDCAKDIIELVSYEDHFRHFVANELNIPHGMLNFIFGRSLESLLPMFGCTLKKKDNAKYLEVTSP